MPVPTPCEYGVAIEPANEALRQAGEAFLTRFPWPQGTQRPEHLLRQGPAAQAILQAAREWKADLVVLGTHARRGLSRLLLGSTAEAVVRHSTCPVICVSHPPRSARTSQHGCGGGAGGNV